MTIIWIIVLVVAYFGICVWTERSIENDSAPNNSSCSLKSTGPTKISIGCGEGSYPDSELNHDFKRISRPAMFPYRHDRANDKLVCKICGYETTGFAHDLAVNTLVQQVNSSEYETIRILEDEEYRERLRKRFKFDK